MAQTPADSILGVLLYHFCRLRLPTIPLPLEIFLEQLRQTYALYRGKQEPPGAGVSWETFLDNLHALDWFLARACLAGQPTAWETLFAARANRSDCLLVDALRMRAVRLFPRDEDRQDQAVADFWGYLLAGEREGSLPILARYDGQRPLIPWLIRVFQNKILSELRQRHGLQALSEVELGDHSLLFPASEERWHEEFCGLAREWLTELTDHEVLLLGLRLRYRLSQREVAALLGIHEGNISRQTARLRDHCREQIGRRLQELGWNGDDLTAFIFKEMDSLLLDEPRLSADRLAALLAARGKNRPVGNREA